MSGKESMKGKGTGKRDRKKEQGQGNGKRQWKRQGTEKGEYSWNIDVQSYTKTWV